MYKYYELMAAVCAGAAPRRPCFPDPWVGHIPFAYFTTQLPGINRIVEVGASSGVSFFSFCQGLSDAGSTGEIIAIVPPCNSGVEESAYEKTYSELWSYNQDHYAQFAKIIRQPWVDSLLSFSDSSIDLLHIISGPNGEDAKSVFQAWLPKLRPNALVLIHGTTAVKESARTFEFWKEIEGNNRCSVNLLHSGGLGVFQIPGDDGLMFDWLEDDFSRRLTRQMFSAAGMRITELARQNLADKEIKDKLLAQIAEQHSLRLDLNALSSQISPLTKWLGDITGGVSREEYMKILSKPGMLTDWMIINSTNTFDRRWYSERYPDALGYADGPLIHYLEHGRIEGRECAPFFLPNQPAGALADHSPLPKLFDSPPPSQRELQAEIARERSRKMERTINLLMPVTKVPIAPLKFAVVVHVFYLDIFRKIVRSLEAVNIPYSMIVTTPKSVDQEEIVKICKRAKVPHPEIIVLENRGRDILPKLKAADRLLADHDVALFLHTKKSPHLAKDHGWLLHVMECLCGSEHRVRQVLDCFLEIPHLGMISPSTPDWLKPALNWGGNFPVAAAVAKEAKFADLPDEIDFPAGSMFWARPSALRPLMKSVIWDMFEDEAGQLDGTIAHGIERLFFVACENAGFQWFKIASDNYQNNNSSVVNIEAFEDLLIYLEFAKRHLIKRRFIEVS